LTVYDAGINQPNNEDEQKNPSQHYSCKKKPIEIYSFVDPLCPECWALEPILKKLQIEYGQYFRIRHLMGGKLKLWNSYKQKHDGIVSLKDVASMWERTANRSGMSCDGDLWFENPISTPYAASIAVKAAELQGKHAGVQYLRKLREVLFLQKQNITKEDVLIDCAKEVGLDVNEFRADMHSRGAIKAFQCDVKITREMDVQELPTLVFFNDRAEDEGLKITGTYQYEVYVHILTEMLGKEPIKEEAPTLIELLKRYNFIATKEIAVVFNTTCKEIEREMKKLMLQQTVERVPVKYGTFWRYIGSNKNE
jgi:predicted DsbA family dithiol-disulfide isomerase